MVIRETTHRFSRLSFHRSMVGRRLPMLLTAAGRAYIANCPEQERQHILQLLANRNDSQSGLAQDQNYIDKLVRKTRQDGYGSNYRDWGEEGRIAAIALPIRHDDRVLGCLNLVYIADAMTIEEAARRYLEAMQSVIGRIEARLNPVID
jgi:IclR family mhp operon transcriptional activator